MKQIKSESYFGYAISRQGGRAENQDTCAIRETCHGLLVLVCDGMGGGPSGKAASMLAAQTICDSVASNLNAEDRIDILNKAIKAAHKAILDDVARCPQNKGMGTTVTALLISEESAVVAHVGDSRVYQFRRGEKKFRTMDHSMVFELISGDKRGRKRAEAEEQARLSPQSNVITRALGHGASVHPDIVELPYEKGDRFMLCSDGIWGMQPEKDIVRTVAKTKSIAGIIDSLTVTTEALGKAKGGYHDNFTAAIIESTINSKLKEKMSRTHRYMMMALAVVCGISLIANLVAFSGRESGSEGRSVKAVVDSVENVYGKKIETLKHERDSVEDALSDTIKRRDNTIETLEKNIKDKDAKIKELGNSTISKPVNDLASELDAVISRLKKISEITIGKKRASSVDNAKKDLNNIAAKMKRQGMATAHVNKAVSLMGNDIAKRNEDGNKSVKGHFDGVIKELNAAKNDVK